MRGAAASSTQMGTNEEQEAKRARTTGSEGATDPSDDKCKESAAASRAVIVHVVRHGQVDNPNAIFYGRLPGFDLHKDGWEQARQAGRYLADTMSEPSTALVVSSPMLRAQSTAKTIAGCLGVGGEAVRTEEGVNEVHSPHDGKTIAEMARLNWAIYETGPEWEKFEDVGKRTVSTLRKLALEVLNETNGGSLKEIVLVSHGDVCVLARLFGLGREFTIKERTRLQDEGYPSYCSVSSLSINGDGQCVSMKVHSTIDANPDGKKS